MNYILGLLFLLLIFPYYYMVGRKALSLLQYEYDFDHAILAGFITTFFVGFIVGEPLQLIHSSWNVFFIMMSISLVLLGGFCFKKEYFVINKEKIIEYLQNHWFIFLLTGLFLFFAITNLLPYYQMNYDDSYYLGKVLNQIGTPVLSNENYFSGAVVEEIAGGITRSINTFEMVYGYFATLFHIGVPFFCRVCIACQNYLLMFITYQSFAKIFVSKKHSQYAVAIFSIFLIVCGYWQESEAAPMVIRIFDGWQLTTAMWYGGSVVRMLSIPMVILFGKELWQKLDIRKLIFVVMIYTTFISFSTIFFHNGVILFMIFVFIQCLEYIFSDNKILKLLGISVCVIFLFTVIWFNKNIGRFAFINIEKLVENVDEFAKYYSHYYSSDLFFTYGPVILMIGMMLGKNRYERYTIGTVLGIYLMEYKMFLINLVMFSTGYYFFVALRLMSSLQYMIVLVLGISIVALIEKMDIHILFHAGLSMIVVVASLLLLYKDYSYIVAQDFSGSGIIPGGYSLRTLTTNDEMIPPMYVRIGDYFNSLPYGNYSIMAPKHIDYYGFDLPYVGLVCTSNRIELFERRSGCGDLTKDEFLLIQSYFNGEVSYSTVLPIIERIQIQYFIVQTENQKADMDAQGYSLIMESDESAPYYLYKTNL